MKLTEKTVTRQALEALAVDDILYLVQINTDKPGYHYISGFESKEQCRMYRALLEDKSFDYSYTQSQEIGFTYDCVAVEGNMTITPVSQYRIKKTDPVYLTHPHLTSKDLLVMADELLAPKQVEQVVETLPTVSNTVRGRYPEYLKALYILSTATYQTEDKTASYRIAVVNKSPTGVSIDSICYDSIYLVLDKHNNYRGFSDSEHRAIELAELIIRKPAPDYIRP